MKSFLVALISGQRHVKEAYYLKSKIQAGRAIRVLLELKNRPNTQD